MTLTEQQIQTLFTFTEKKFVKWYDLQVELVDHLANKIEELMDADNSLSFERALANVYSTFGLFGFAHIVQEKQHELEKRNNRLLWNEIKNQFSWPNVVRSIAIFGVISIAIININVEMIAYITMFILLLDFIFFRMKQFLTSKKNKPLLITQVLPSFNYGGFLYTQLLIFTLNDAYTQILNFPNYYKAIIILLLFIGYIFVVASKTIELNMIAKAKKLYPMAFS